MVNFSPRSFTALLALLTWLVASTSICAAPAPPSESLAPPNLVAISERITTAGQPSADWLSSLKLQGYDAVIYLAPATVSDAVKDEPLIVSRQGLIFVNIPIKFASPTEQDFENFAAIMVALNKKKVLVHCQINLRASSMVFLYRTIVLKENPNTAYDSVSKVWVPDGAWKQLIQDQLKKHHINFVPF